MLVSAGCQSAPLKRIELSSPDRQSGSLTRCLQGQIVGTPRWGPHGQFQERMNTAAGPGRFRLHAGGIRVAAFPPLGGGGATSKVLSSCQGSGWLIASQSQHRAKESNPRRQDQNLPPYHWASPVCSVATDLRRLQAPLDPQSQLLVRHLLVSLQTYELRQPP